MGIIVLFCSTDFIYFFFPIVLLGYYVLFSIRQIELGKIWLVFSSLFFYGFWKPIYLPLIVVSIFINFYIAKLILQNKMADKCKSNLLLLGILFNVGLLVFFKYFDFFVMNFSIMAGITNPIKLNLLLPLGISFFTFQQIAYLVDCRKSAAKKHDIVTYSLFVTFFPQLIAGPIVHHKEMMPQFENKKNPLFNLQNITIGIFLFSVGFFKKIVIADSFATWADKGFSNVDKLMALDAWIASLSYTFQLYFDFSGYTDMAMGLALFFGVSLPINFNSPYKASSIQEFWRRWHITLSRWLRDYVYIPLGGNQASLSRHYMNLFIVFLIGGLWHGAGWTFIVWGLLHGSAIVIHRIWTRFNIDMPHCLATFVTFIFVNITWVFFRAENIQSATRIVKKMFDPNTLGLTKYSMHLLSKLTGWKYINYIVAPKTTAAVFSNPIHIIFSLFLALILVTWFKSSVEYAREFEKKGSIRLLMASQFSAILFITALASTYIVSGSKFLYFNF